MCFVSMSAFGNFFVTRGHRVRWQPLKEQSWKVEFEEMEQG